MASDPSADAAVAAAAALFARARDRVCEVVRGKDDVVELALVAVAASGHLLLEDVPGVGKTTLATALASAIGGSLRRIQFTSDLLPGDITGVNVLDADRGGFTFRPARQLNHGPALRYVVLMDDMRPVMGGYIDVGEWRCLNFGMGPFVNRGSWIGLFVRIA